MRGTKLKETGHVLEILKNVYDPDYRDKFIVDLGLVKETTLR